MRRAAAALALLLALGLLAPVDGRAQTKDDTVVYAIQSDMQNWDPATTSSTTSPPAT